MSNRDKTGNRKGLRYALITAARNEVAFLEGTIMSVVSQTLLPVRWVIVSDGSSDGTDELAERYAALHGWITVLRQAPRSGRDFAGKVNAFKRGYESIVGEEFDLIANLDADISFDQNYLQFLANQFENDRELGVAGTPRI